MMFHHQDGSWPNELFVWLRPYESQKLRMNLLKYGNLVPKKLVPALTNNSAFSSFAIKRGTQEGSQQDRQPSARKESIEDIVETQEVGILIEYLVNFELSEVLLSILKGTPFSESESLFVLKYSWSIISFSIRTCKLTELKFKKTFQSKFSSNFGAVFSFSISVGSKIYHCEVRNQLPLRCALRMKHEQNWLLSLVMSNPSVAREAEAEAKAEFIYILWEKLWEFRSAHVANTGREAEEKVWGERIL